jgi:hypothetical protein
LKRVHAEKPPGAFALGDSTQVAALGSSGRHKGVLLKFKILPEDKTQPVIKRMFFLAWRACGKPQGMGVHRDRGPNVSEEEVFQNILEKGDYPERPKNPSQLHQPGTLSADYVFGRMMKMHLEFGDDWISWRDTELDPEYESWCESYRSYESLLQNAAREMNAAAEPIGEEASC